MLKPNYTCRAKVALTDISVSSLHQIVRDSNFLLETSKYQCLLNSFALCYFPHTRSFTIYDALELFNKIKVSLSDKQIKFIFNNSFFSYPITCGYPSCFSSILFCKKSHRDSMVFYFYSFSLFQSRHYPSVCRGFES